VDSNLTVEGQYPGSRTNLETVGLVVVLLIVVASFLAGCLLGEDSAGGMRYDFYFGHWPIIERFSAMPWATAVSDYRSTENPLLYIITSLLPLHNSQKLYHIITSMAGVLIWPLLSWAYYRRYSKYGIDWLWASFGASAILISPSFRSSAFWGDTDWLPFGFCAITSLLLSRYQDCEFNEARDVNIFTLITLAVVSSCAFYTRQFYAFLPIFAAWITITRNKTSPLLVLGVFTIMALPEMFLVYLWDGIVPPSYRGVHLRPSLINVWKTGAIIGFLSFPIIVGCIRRSLRDVLQDRWGARSTLIVVGGLFIFTMVIMALAPPEWLEANPQNRGGGIIVKAGLIMGALGTPFILTASYFGFIATIVFSIRSITNAVLMGTYLVPFFLTVPVYQRWLEPSLVVVLFLFADTQTARVAFNKRVLVYNFVFTGMILAISIIYYDFFLSVTSYPAPST
jgi:hypothetical protein